MKALITFSHTDSDRKIQESTSKEVTLQDDNPVAIDCMLEYIYAGNFDDLVPTPGNPITVQFLRRLVDLYSVADKYDVPRLRHVTAEHFSSAVDEYIEDNKDYENDDELIAIIHTIYDLDGPIESRQTTVRTLREALVLSFLQSANLSPHISIDFTPLFRACIAAQPELAQDVLLKASTLHPGETLQTLRKSIC